MIGAVGGSGEGVWAAVQSDGESSPLIGYSVDDAVCLLCGLPKRPSKGGAW